MTDKEIDSMLKDSKICPHCGGKMVEVYENYEDEDGRDGSQYHDECTDCNYVEVL